jgi:hypothetical protein
MAIISVDFDAVDLLFRYCAFVRYLENNGSTYSGIMYKVFIDF